MSATAIDIARSHADRSHLVPLRQAVNEWGHTLGTLAVMVNMSVDVLQRKLNGFCEFGLAELVAVCHIIGANPETLFDKKQLESIPLNSDLITVKRSLKATPESITWAAANLDHLGERIVFSNTKAETERAESGEIFRDAFTISVAPGSDTAFIIKLFAGASTRDLKEARQLIAEAKRGIFHEDTWTRIPRFSDKDFGGWRFMLELRHDGSPEPDEIKQCNVDGCREQWHPWTEGEPDSPCVGTVIRGFEDLYEVRAMRWLGEDWKADLVSDHDMVPSGPPGLKFIRDLANDFAWVQGECDRLNAGQGAAA